MTMRVAMVTTHPIQYQVPWLRMLAAREELDLRVFFAMIPDAAEQGRDFGVSFEWDMPLLDGYEYTVLDNRSEHPSLTEFAGCDTPQIDDEIRRGRFDAVIVNGWGTKTALQALWACRRQGIPCIVRGEANGLRPRAWWKRLGHRLLLSQYAAVLAIGMRNREYCLARDVAAARLFDTPYCVDNARFAAAADAVRAQLDRAARCARFGLDAARTTFLFSGKFVAKKRPGDLIAALRHAVAECCDRAQLLLVGDGPLRAELQAQASGLPVAFAGFLNQSQMGEAYAVADALVLPSDHGETWGLVVNEAMACGLPAFVSDQVGCAADLISIGKTGESFACGDVSALAGLIVRYASVPERLHEMGVTARARVNADYHFGRVVDGVLAAVRAVVPGRG